MTDERFLLDPAQREKLYIFICNIYIVLIYDPALLWIYYLVCNIYGYNQKINNIVDEAYKQNLSCQVNIIYPS